eukprot:jgi/Psemu1/13817/gm1.13817_g
MPTPPALRLSPALTILGEVGPPGGGGTADSALPAWALAKHRTTKFNLEPTPASASGTYSFHRNQTWETVTNEETSIEQWLLQRLTFDQWEAVFRTVLTAFKESTGDKTLSPSNVQDVLEASNQGFRTHESHRRESNLHSIGRATQRFLNPPHPNDHSDALMNTNARLTEDLGKTKSQPPALARAGQDKVTQLFNYFSPDLSELTQTPGDMLLDRTTRLKSTFPSQDCPTSTPYQSFPRKSAQFTSFWEESDNAKVHLVNTYFTSRTDVGVWCTLHANNSTGYLHIVDPHSLLALAFNSRGGTDSNPTKRNDEMTTEMRNIRFPMNESDLESNASPLLGNH